MTTYEIAKDFISKMNPSGWDGIGFENKPKDFRDKYSITYDVNGHPDIDLDIHFEYDGCDDAYWYVCEAYDNGTQDRIGEGVWGSDVNSIDGLDIAIREVFKHLNIKI